MSLSPSYQSIFSSFIKSPVSTPAYIYSNQKLIQNISLFSDLAKKHLIQVHYAMKANNNAQILRMVKEAGLSVDVNSMGELTQALKIGFLPSNLIFAGVGKTDSELELAVKLGLKTIKVESVDELSVLSEITNHLGISANIGLRLNPEIDAKTHPYIATGLSTSKFGIDKRDIDQIISILSNFPLLRLTTLDAHIGSQITDLNLFVDVFTFLSNQANFINKKGFSITDLDLGGGFAIEYDGSGQSTLPELDTLFSKIALLNNGAFKISIEPGRAVVANTCAILTRVLYTKTNGDKNFAIVDAAMTDNIRPSLYGSVHPIVKIGQGSVSETLVYDVVGPVCESGDFLGEDVSLSQCKRGDFLAILDSGAYTSAMASNYNMRPLLPEYLEKDGCLIEIRRRQNVNEWLENLEIPYEG